MFEWIVSRIVAFMGLCLQGLAWIWSFLSNHLWALFVSVFTVVMSVWTSLMETISKWINSLVDPINLNSDLSFGSALGDCVDKVIISNLGNDAFSCLVKDLVYGFNFGTFFTHMTAIFLPTVIAVFTYRLIKSYIPTISGS